MTFGRNLAVAAIVATWMVNAGPALRAAAEDTGPPAGCGPALAVDDFTGDGRLDVMTSSLDPDRSLRLYRNESDGSFTDVTEAAGLAGQLGGIHILTGDYDNDGLLDVLVLRGGGAGSPDGEIPNSLIRQVEPGRFQDVTGASGIEVAAPTRTAAFGDIDRDGDLDLFVGYEAGYDHHLWINQGDGTFREGLSGSGIVVPVAAGCAAAVFGDIDRDGDPDLFLSLRGVPNVMYRNRGDGTFEDVTEAAGVAGPDASTAAGFLDANNDGYLDLFVAGESSLPAKTAASLASDGDGDGDGDGEGPDGTCRLYQNRRDGTFKDVTAAQGLAMAFAGPSIAFGDVNGDGFPDLFLGATNAESSTPWPGVLLQNRNGGKFVDITTASGTAAPPTAQGLAFADPDDDGDQDLLVQTGSFQPDALGDVLFLNPDTPQLWVRVELEGKDSNRFGVGARLSLRVRERNRERFIEREVGVGSSTGGSPHRLEIGLGKSDRLLWLNVHWPSGEKSKIFQPPTGATLRIREGEKDIEVVRTVPVSFATDGP